MRTRTALVALTASLMTAGASAADPVRVNIQWGRSHQTIVGFGGTMGWIHPGERIREEVYDLLFTKLGVSFLRIRALGGEGGDELSIEPKNDNNDPNVFNWPAFPLYITEAKNARTILAALKRGVKHVMPVTWSPPGWMKESGKRAGGGTLKEENLDELAEAWAAYVLGMKREFDIDIRMLSIQNEPELSYYYPTCTYEPGLYARAVKAVQRRFDRMGARVSVLGPDVCRLYNLERYRDKMLLQGYAERGRGIWPKPFLVHHYDLSVGYHEVDKDAHVWRKARELARGTGQPLWLMETANYLSYEVRQGSYLEALIWARKIHHALVDGDCEVVCYWALFFDKVGESLVYCREDGLNSYQISHKYYTSMNYYKFVRPGMVRKGAFSADDDLFVSAFENERDAARVVVVVNWSHAPKRVTFGTRVDATYERHETTKERDCERVAFDPANLELPARSVTTFVKSAAE